MHLILSVIPQRLGNPLFKIQQFVCLLVIDVNVDVVVIVILQVPIFTISHFGR